MSEKPAILLYHKHLAPLTGMLESAYDVWNLWEHPPVEAQDAIRAIVVDGAYPLDTALVERLPNLGLIACFAAGYDGIDIQWARERGLPVTHAPGVNHEDVADLAIGLILASRRHIVSGDRSVREGAWRTDVRTITPSLGGQRVGIIGLGRIGEAIARRCEVMRMEVAWWGPREKPDAAWPRRSSLLDLAKGSDILVVACRADERSRGIVTGEVIDAVGAEGLLVNVSRGQVVDEEALIDGLRARRLGAAALDVFAEEPTPAERWAAVPNTVFTPHIGGATTAAVQGMLMLLLQNLQAHFAGEPLKTPVPA
jgi:lactate dehydrogenase-like 2-hydroxyacid dehydrogenase